MKKSILFTFFFIFSFISLKIYAEDLLKITENDFAIGDENAPITIST